MAKIYVNTVSGEVAKASQFNGLKTIISSLGFELFIDNYRSYFYGIFRKRNPNTGKYEFKKISKINPQKEQILKNQGYEKVKLAYSNFIPEQYLWRGKIEKENNEEV